MIAIETFEPDDEDDECGQIGIRHMACVEEGQQTYGAFDIQDIEAWPDPRECWGCLGWIDEDPLTPLESALKEEAGLVNGEINAGRNVEVLLDVERRLAELIRLVHARVEAEKKEMHG